MILSNWHVLAGSEFSQRGDRILQPGVGDRGGLRDGIAHLDRHAMHAGIDAAVAELNDTRSITNEQLGLGAVTGVTAPALQMEVRKSGRTSEITRARVTGIVGTRKINYHGFERLVHHVIHLAQVEPQTEVSAPGDSGSWWLEAGTNRAVGLHMAGSNEPEYGLAIAMPQVFEALAVDLPASGV
jgi:endonuclease G